MQKNEIRNVKGVNSGKGKDDYDRKGNNSNKFYAFAEIDEEENN